MKRKPVERRFKVFPASGFSTKFFETVLHSSQTELTAAYRSALKETGETGETVRQGAPDAFFCSRASDPLKVGELHFCAASLDAPVVSHEATHATLEWFRRDACQHSLFEHDETEEVFARVLENIVAQVLLGFARQ